MKALTTTPSISTTKLKNVVDAMDGDVSLNKLSRFTENELILVCRCCPKCS